MESFEILLYTAPEGKTHIEVFFEDETFWLSQKKIGYRVNSHEATRFRIWSTKTLKEFIIKGFVLDDERLIITFTHTHTSS